MNKDSKTLITYFFKRLILLVFLVPFWIYFRSLYRDRIGAFGCFDDCFNIMAGHFLGAGKKLYLDIFFNHQPLAAYISFLIQQYTKPSTIYLLIYQHRMFVIYFSLIAQAILVLRFGVIGAAFTLLYESTKGFIFGERFLAESMIVYPLIYLYGTVYCSHFKKYIFKAEMITAAFLTWFVIFMREPFIPLAILLYGYILYLNRKNKLIGFSIIIFFSLVFATISYHDLNSYFYNVVSLNLQIFGSGSSELTFSLNRLLQIFFAPLYVLSGGKINLLHLVQAGLSVIFLILLVLNFQTKTGKKWLVVAFLILGFSNLRAVAPGEIYYAAFHQIVWYGFMIFTVLLILNQTWEQKKLRKFAAILSIFYSILVIFAFTSKQSYLRDKVDRQTEFNTNYGHYFVVGEVVRQLSTPANTLFLDEWDDLIYWQAKLNSPYRYAWYTSFMSSVAKFRQAREEMFQTNPPDFYYGKCRDQNDEISLPADQIHNYVRLLSGGNPSCVFVKKTIISGINALQWKTIKEQFNYELPDIGILGN